MIRLHNLTSLASLALCSMASEAPTPESGTVAAKAPEPKTVLNDMDSRRMFDSPADAMAYLNQMGETLSDFNSQHFVMKGIAPNETTGTLDFDPNIYTDDMRVMVSVLTQRQTNGPSKVTAIVITPAPKMSAILASETGTAWAAAILDKELNHVAVRQLRNPKDGASLDDLAETMPITLDAYITSQRADGGALESFNELARGIIDAIGKKSKVWLKARLTKPELRSAFASKAYASEYYPTLEDRGEGKDSLFVMALNFAKEVAKSKGLSLDIFDRWLSTRDETKLVSKSESDGDEDFDLSSLTFESTDATTKPAEAVAETQPDSTPEATA